MFTGHNGGDTRGWHHVQEGQYLKQGKDREVWTAAQPLLLREMPAMRSTHPVPRFTHYDHPGGWLGVASALARTLLRGRPLHHQVIASVRKPDGATFVTTGMTGSAADGGPDVSSGLSREFTGGRCRGRGLSGGNTLRMARTIKVRLIRPPDGSTGFGDGICRASGMWT